MPALGGTGDSWLQISRPGYIPLVEERAGGNPTRRIRRPRRTPRPRGPFDPGPLVEYDPLDYANLARSCVAQLMGQPIHRLAAVQPFRGAGVYALFYTGDFPPYAALRSPDATRPIYVGKADPSGGRKGTATGASATRTELFDRINEHTTSIRAVNNLSEDDFLCRYLAVVPLWIRMVERFLIEEHRPAWNGCLDGFGQHDPGRGRSPIVSWWDAMHPGREIGLGWTGALRRTRTQADAEARLRQWLALPEPPVILEDETGA